MYYNYCVDYLYIYSSGTTSLIDFEYSGTNYSAFDVTCFFTKFAGMADLMEGGR